MMAALPLKEPHLLSPLSLAFMGDGVYELLVRRHILAQKGNLPAHRLHLLAIGYVRACAQAAALSRIEPLLTEEEQNVCRRGRNANGVSVPKSASAADYRKATALEALFGYLYLAGQTERIDALFLAIVRSAEPDAQENNACEGTRNVSY